METETITQPNAADELAAGRPYPMRDPFEPATHAAAVDLMQARRQWWLDVADYYAQVASELEDNNPVWREYVADAHTALEESRKYAPKAGA